MVRLQSDDETVEEVSNEMKASRWKVAGKVAISLGLMGFAAVCGFSFGSLRNTAGQSMLSADESDGDFMECSLLRDCPAGFYCGGKKKGCMNTCEDTSDCPREWKCQGTPGTGAPKTCKPAPQSCEVDEECRRNHGCINGFCDLKPIDHCDRNDDCPKAFWCFKQLCVKKVQTCTTTDDCPGGYRCQGGGVGSKNVKQCNKMKHYCEKDFSCKRNKVCVNNLCVLKEEGPGTD
eukprot:TRINITY_DN2270_c0_g1_i1.p1 TRINITY_DN2270_c0_g1~~TRINITY_DN2270_c0_g1_i1.p1  ORF type:complete len:233 (-),score=31.43 TRINITY_DN2270_c0_g1_i1:127-825(-)